MLRKLPIGIQNFEKLIRENFIYVDKTDYIYNLIQQKTPIFLSRPRRFGKSLLTSTMAAYWEGKKELFTGLKIAKLMGRDEHTRQSANTEQSKLIKHHKKEECGEQIRQNDSTWTPHPVFYFDFDGGIYSGNITGLNSRLSEHLSLWETEYSINRIDDTKNTIKRANSGNSSRSRQEELDEALNELGIRFRNLMREAHNQTGQRVVILVDEYDKPLLEVIEQPELERYNKNLFKGFFSSLKAADEDIEFVFITGVTKFEKVSIFSDLNQLEDISQDEDYAGICGITEQEIDEYFTGEIQHMAEKHNISKNDVRKRLKATYDGYRFSSYIDVKVYNPYSLLTSFKKRQFEHYWFSTATPTFLVNKMVKRAFDARKLMDKTLYADGQRISDYRADTPDLIPLLYQAGYLTITDYDGKRKRYTLGFPNEEVKYGMLNSLLPAYAPKTLIDTGIDVFSLDEALERGEMERIKNIFTGLFAIIPYPSVKNMKDEEAVCDLHDPFENYFQSVIVITLTLLGQLVSCEQHTATGRIDCVVKTEKFIYVFEFKRDGNVEDALKQIEERGYALPFLADHERKLYKIGVVFDSKKRTLKDWKVAE